jgi:hypothetical protein
MQGTVQVLYGEEHDFDPTGQDMSSRDSKLLSVYVIPALLLHDPLPMISARVHRSLLPSRAPNLLAAFAHYDVLTVSMVYTTTLADHVRLRAVDDVSINNHPHD